MQRQVLASLLMSAASALPALAETIHVANCGDNTWTGASDLCAAPNGPKRTIQAAVTAAVNGDTVLVADGTYTGIGNRNIRINAKHITVRSVSGNPEMCTIDVQGGPSARRRAFFFVDGGSGESVVEGFTIQGGYAPADGYPEYGGAVVSDSSSPVFRNCIFQDNWARAGGAIIIFDGNFTAIGCTFRDNTGEEYSGAIHSQASEFGVLTNCTFLHNRTNDPNNNGGGAMTAFTAAYTVSRCRFIENTTARLCGGLWINHAQATVTDCTFEGNSAVLGGSGMTVCRDAHATLVNCLFNRNLAASSGEGGALWVLDGNGGPASATVVNCTFNQNEVPSDSAALFVSQTSSASVANCIFWANTPTQIVTEPAATATVSYSDIQGAGVWPGTGNILADPLFTDAVDGDCRLSRSSPCIDAGNSLVDIDPLVEGVQPIPLTNLDGLPRRVDIPTIADTGVGPPVVDMGAYEVQLCAADLNGDGIVDFSDYLEFLNFFDAGDLRADFTGDGIVDFADYLEFLNLFDAGC